MPLHLRRRADVWHARGTVRVGRETIHVREFSTGCRARADATAVAAEEEARIRGDALDGGAGRARRLTIDDCFLVYLRRPAGVGRNDRDKIGELGERIGPRPIGEAAQAWADMLRTRGASWAPSTAARWRAILQAALHAGCEAHSVPWPRLPTVKEPTQEIATYLTMRERDALLAAYNASAGAVALALCFAGLRTQEALQLDWRHVDWRRNLLIIAGAAAEGHGQVRRRTKSGRGRSVPMHPRLRTRLETIWNARSCPDAGPVFLSERGHPYADTADVGGNPLAKAHHTACLKAGLSRPSGRVSAAGKPILVPTFRVHDWRHHWASSMVMSGTDLYTLMRLGGWTTPRMVQRYASVSGDHLASAIARIR